MSPPSGFGGGVRPDVTPFVLWSRNFGGVGTEYGNKGLMALSPPFAAVGPKQPALSFFVSQCNVMLCFRLFWEGNTKDERKRCYVYKKQQRQAKIQFLSAPLCAWCLQGLIAEFYHV